MNTDNYFHKIVTGSPVLSDSVKKVILDNETSISDELKMDIIKTILGYEKSVSIGIYEFLQQKVQDAK